MTTHQCPQGVRLHDPESDTLRLERSWPVIDPETGERRILRLRVGRGRLVDVEDGEDTQP